MRAEQFIKDHGLEWARDAIEEANAYGGFWLNAKTLELSNYIPSYDAVGIPELQRLVESVDLVNSLGGLQGARKEAHRDCFAFEKNKPLLRAINDYESIYGEGNE